MDGGDDFLSTVTGGAMSDAPTQAVDPNIDAAVRTAYAEAGKGGYGAVAGVIRNRAVKSGKTFSEVVAEPNAFEGYNDKQYKALKPGSPQYQAVLNEVLPVLQGQADNPVGSADAYFSPTGQKAKGRQAPSWSQGKQPVANVGGNVFYADVYQPQKPAGDFLGTVTGGAMSDKAAPALTATPAEKPVATAAAAPSVIAKPQPIEQSDLFQGYDQNGNPVWSQPGVEATDPDLPKAPKGYYWPAGTEVGQDGKPRVRVAEGYDPNLRETFDPEKIADELTMMRLQATPGGQTAVANAANAPDETGKPDSGVLGHAANGAMLGFLPQVNGAIGYVQQGAQNLVNQLTGQPITVRAQDAYDAERLGTKAILGEESALHPIAAPIAEAGGALATTVPAGEAVNLGIRALPAGARALGAGDGVVNALTTGSRFATGQAGAGQGAIPFLVRTGSNTANGALQGAVGGALTTNLNKQPLGDNLLTGAVTGGAIGGGVPLIYDTLKGGIGAGRAALQPFTEQGRNEIVGQVLRSYADGGPTDLNLTQYVPGAPQPTLAQATGNRGLAAVERAVRAGNPTANNAFDAVSRQAQDAREAAVGALRGDADSLEQLRQIRSAQADPIREQAFANAQPVDPTSVMRKIDDIIASPSGQRDAVVKTLQNIRSKLLETTQTIRTPGGEGYTKTTYQAQPAQLYGIRQAITDMLSPLAQKDASAPQLASRELLQVKDALDGAIEQGAPGYRGYLKTYSDLSRPIDEQLFLQGKNFTDASGRVTLAKVKAVQDQLERAELAPGTSRAKNVSDATREGLDNLRQDLLRESASSPDRNLGSNTFQNLATNNLLNKIGVPLAIGDAVGVHALPIPGWLSGVAGLGARAAYASKNPLILDQLTNALVNPQVGGAMLAAAPRAGVNLDKIPAVLPAVRQLPAPAAALRNLLMSPREATAGNGAS